MSAEPKSRSRTTPPTPRASSPQALAPRAAPPRAAPPRAASTAPASRLPLVRGTPSSASPPRPTGQDFGFLRAAPPKQAPSTPPVDPRDVFPPLESAILPAKEPSPPDASRARTIRLAPSPRPKLDATVVAKRMPPKK